MTNISISSLPTENAWAFAKSNAIQAVGIMSFGEFVLNDADNGVAQNVFQQNVVRQKRNVLQSEIQWHTHFNDRKKGVNKDRLSTKPRNYDNIKCIIYVGEVKASDTNMQKV